jgi:hypothetical protein
MLFQGRLYPMSEILSREDYDAAQRAEIQRLRTRLEVAEKLITDAPHDEECNGHPETGSCANCEVDGTPGCPLSPEHCPRFQLAPCNCWKAAFAAEVKE